MGLFRKKVDPISDRARELKGKIASLESRIQKLHTKIGDARTQPRLRSTALPPGRTPPSKTAPPEPIFEPIDLKPAGPADGATTPARYNDLGVRKYDLAAAWKRLQNHFRSPPANNPKLVSYLAAGSIKGLRPLRYEKRVARNRFLSLFLFFLLILWGIVYMLVRR